MKKITQKLVIIILISLSWTLCLQLGKSTLMIEASTPALSLESMSDARRAVFNKMLDQAAHESQMDPLELLRLGLQHHREMQFKELNLTPQPTSRAPVAPLTTTPKPQQHKPEPKLAAKPNEKPKKGPIRQEEPRAQTQSQKTEKPTTQEAQSKQLKFRVADSSKDDSRQEHPRILLGKIIGASKTPSQQVEQITQESETSELTNEQLSTIIDTLESTASRDNGSDLAATPTTEASTEALELTSPIAEDSSSSRTESSEERGSGVGELEVTTTPVTISVEEISSPSTGTNLIIGEAEIPETTTANPTAEPTTQTVSAPANSNQLTFETSTSNSKPELLDVEIEATTKKPEAPISPLLVLKAPRPSTVTAGIALEPSGAIIHHEEEEEEELEERQETSSSSSRNIRRKFEKKIKSPLTPLELLDPVEPSSGGSSSFLPFRDNQEQQEPLEEEAGTTTKQGNSFNAKTTTQNPAGKSEESKAESSAEAQSELTLATTAPNGTAKSKSSPSSPDEQVKVEDKTYIDRSDPSNPKRVKVMSRSKSIIGKDGTAKREHTESRVVTSLGAPGSDPTSFIHQSTSSSHVVTSSTSSSSSSSSKKSTQKTSSSNNNNGFDSLNGFGRMSAPSAPFAPHFMPPSGFIRGSSFWPMESHAADSHWNPSRVFGLTSSQPESIIATSSPLFAPTTPRNNNSSHKQSVR